MTTRSPGRAPELRTWCMTIVRRAASVTAILVLLATAPAAAQGAGASGPQPFGRVEVAIGAALLGSGPLGTRQASLRANSLEPEPFRVFDTETRFARAAMIEARAGVPLSRRYAIEGGFAFARPELRTSVSADVEDAPPLVVTESIDQYLIDAALVVALEDIRLGPVLPVVSGGLGYVRQLHKGRTVVEQGHYFHAGAGVRHWLGAGGQGLVKGSGIRADVRLYVFDGGIQIEDGVRTQGSVSGSFFVVF